MWIKCAFFAIFPLIFAESAFSGNLFSVNFARKSGFPHLRTAFHILLKTKPENPGFPQARRKNRLQQPVVSGDTKCFPQTLRTGKQTGKILRKSTESAKIAEQRRFFVFLIRFCRFYTRIAETASPFPGRFPKILNRENAGGTGRKIRLRYRKTQFTHSGEAKICEN